MQPFCRVPLGCTTSLSRCRGDAGQIPQPLTQGLLADDSPLLHLQHLSHGRLRLGCRDQRVDFHQQRWTVLLRQRLTCLSPWGGLAASAPGGSLGAGQRELRKPMVQASSSAWHSPAPEWPQPTESPVVQQPVSAVMTTPVLSVNQESPLQLSRSM
jgi:hypothetical protein